MFFSTVAFSLPSAANQAASSSTAPPPPLPLTSPGFRFHPTDEELLCYYLTRKLLNRPFYLNAISDLDVYLLEPWDLPSFSRLRTRDLEWYFFTPLYRKQCSRNLVRTNRATPRGFWRITGKDKEIRRRSSINGGGGGIIGWKKTLVFHFGRTGNGETQRTDWVMHEYRLAHEEMARLGVVQDAFVVCRVFEKSGLGSKNGEQYGASYIEEEWEEPSELIPITEENEGSEVITMLLKDGDWENFVQVMDVDIDKEFGGLLDDLPEINGPGEASGLKNASADSSVETHETDAAGCQPVPPSYQDQSSYVQTMDVSNVGFVDNSPTDISASCIYELPTDKMPEAPEDGSLYLQEPSNHKGGLSTLDGLLQYLDITNENMHYKPPPEADGNVQTWRRPENHFVEDARNDPSSARNFD